MDKSFVRAINIVTNIAYILVSLILFAIAFAIIGWSLWEMGEKITSADLSSGGFRFYGIMDEVAFLIFSIAVADVAKYLMVEHVIFGKIKKPEVEKQIALSNLMLIISTAFALEGLILTIQVAKTQMQSLIYPILLLVIAAILMITIGVYQRLSSKTSKN